MMTTSPAAQPDERLRTVVVLGLARSGTSVVTGMLKILGVDMGPSTDDDANPRGSHEDIDFAKFHRELFEMAGHGTGYWNPPSREQILALRPRVNAIVQGLLQKKSEGKTLWGWKHSRTILTYELFLPYLVNPRFILVFRNLIGTALSSVEHTRKYRNPVDFSRAMKLGHYYHGEMLSFLENHPEIPKLLVCYEAVVADPLKEAEKMADFLGVEVSTEQWRRLTDFVIPRERLGAEKDKRRSFWRGKLPRLMHKLPRIIRNRDGA
jgi:hypothetical protein